MMMTDQEQVILDLIEQLYCKKYTGKLKITETFSKFPGEPDTHLGYILSLGLNKNEKPLTIAYEGDFDGFVNNITQELKSRSLDRTEYFNGIKLYGEDRYTL